MNSDAETEKTISGDETVEESPKEKPQKRKYKKASSTPTINNKQTPVPASNSDKFLIHPKLGKLPKKKTGDIDHNGEEIYCVCRKPDNGELMVACDGCDDWYHFRCVKITVKYQFLVASYFCPYCELEGKGSTLWKRKCRLVSCLKPISGNESKYCSKEHGLQYLKNVVNHILPSQNQESGALDKTQLNELVNFSSSLDSFRHLGEDLPDAPINYEENSKIKSISQELIDLKKQRDLQIKKKKLLIKTRENLEKLNEGLRSSDSTASSSKKKARKIEVCGYDKGFQREDLEELNDADLSSNDTQTLISQYNELQENEGIDTKICLLEKKKCSKHSGWQSIINDEIDLQLNHAESKASKLGIRKERLIKTIKIDYFENQKSG